MKCKCRDKGVLFLLSIPIDVKSSSLSLGHLFRVLHKNITLKTFSFFFSLCKHSSLKYEGVSTLLTDICTSDPL